MREILFRAKSDTEDGFVYGIPLNVHDGVGGKGCIMITNETELYDSCMLQIHGNWKLIDKSTLGQFTGLYDCKGNKIFEGDILLFHNSIKQVVGFKHGAFGYDVFSGFISYAGNTNFDFGLFDTDKNHEIIGNIHDNPEMVPKPYENEKDT